MAIVVVKHIRINGKFLGTVAASEKSVAVALPSAKEETITKRRGHQIVLGRLKALDEAGGGELIPRIRGRKVFIPRGSCVLLGDFITVTTEGTYYEASRSEITAMVTAEIEHAKFRVAQIVAKLADKVVAVKTPKRKVKARKSK